MAGKRFLPLRSSAWRLLHREKVRVGQDSLCGNMLQKCMACLPFLWDTVLAGLEVACKSFVGLGNAVPSLKEGESHCAQAPNGAIVLHLNWIELLFV